jgi:hypothetical protein
MNEGKLEEKPRKIGDTCVKQSVGKVVETHKKVEKEWK